MRALLIVLDSVGIGAAPDAARYGDEGADTLGHLYAYRAASGRELCLPALNSLGLAHLLGRETVDGRRWAVDGGKSGLSRRDYRPPSTASRPLQGSYGRMREQAAGKDSTTGHWELAGVVLHEPFATFEQFPPALVRAIEAEAGVCFLGNVAASGTAIIEELGGEHIRSGRPILYTSADSVLQIAAHEGITPLARLYEICEVARRHADAYRIGRVIARPFVGEPGDFTRTAGRHDLSMKPPRTVLNALIEAGLPVKAIGKTNDLFAGEGITEAYPTGSNRQGMRAIGAVWRETRAGLVFANLVDFDALYGHRRDPESYARALEEFDRWLDGFLPLCAREDLLIVTADHGNDPTFRGTDHTREQVPLLVRHAGRTEDLGDRESFADVAATLSAFFHLAPPWPLGSPFWTEMAAERACTVS